MKNNKLEFENIKGMISLGGLSECGKSAAGKYLESKGFLRLKIKNFEHKIMEYRGMDLSKGVEAKYYDQLYETDPEETVFELLSLMSQHMSNKGKKYVVIESMYRPKMAEILKQILSFRIKNVYIYAPLKIRATRECLKEYGDLDNLDPILERVIEKDNFKNKVGVGKLSTIADISIDNSFSKEIFLDEIDKIRKELLFYNGDEIV